MKHTVMAACELMMKEWISNTQEGLAVYRSVSGGGPCAGLFQVPPSGRLDILVFSPIKHPEKSQAGYVIMLLMIL